MEKIPIKPRNPAHYSTLLFDISIPTSKEESIHIAQLAEEEIKVYTDGSVLCPHVSGLHQDRKVFVPYL